MQRSRSFVPQSRLAFAMCQPYVSTPKIKDSGLLVFAQNPVNYLLRCHARKRLIIKCRIKIQIAVIPEVLDDFFVVRLRAAVTSREVLRYAFSNFLKAKFVASIHGRVSQKIRHAQRVEFLT